MLPKLPVGPELFFEVGRGLHGVHVFVKVSDDVVTVFGNEKPVGLDLHWSALGFEFDFEHGALEPEDELGFFDRLECKVE